MRALGIVLTNMAYWAIAIIAVVALWAAVTWINVLYWRWFVKAIIRGVFG